MKAIAVAPGKKHSAQVVEAPGPSIADVPGGRGVLVKVLRVGVDGTDREINDAQYGRPPEATTYLVLGHEGFGRVEAIGPNVTELTPGDFVVATVRRPGKSLFDAIGTQDMTTDDVYYERGINLLHGFLTEHYVDAADHMVVVPRGAKDVGVLLEPLTVVEKGIAQAYEIQRRLRVWRPRRAAVLGSGTIGLLATLVLRLRGLAVTTFGQDPEAVPERRAAWRPSARGTSSPPRRPCRRRRSATAPRSHLRGLRLLAPPLRRDAGPREERRAGALERDRRRAQVEVDADKLNLEFVLGNKVMVGTVNADREHFELGRPRHGARRVRLPRLAREPAHPPGEGARPRRRALRQLKAARGTRSRCSAR